MDSWPSHDAGGGFFFDIEAVRTKPRCPAQENPSEYWSLYGTFVDFSYAPKTSLKGVLFILLVFAALVEPAVQ